MTALGREVNPPGSSRSVTQPSFTIKYLGRRNIQIVILAQAYMRCFNCGHKANTVDIRLEVHWRQYTKNWV